jgi:hypothetical protein
MTDDSKNSNLIILGISALAAMFFAYLIYSSNKQSQQSQQLPHPDSLRTNQLQEQLIEIQKIQLQQAQNITELENNKCATSTTIPVQPVQPTPQTPVTQEAPFDSGLLSEVTMTPQRTLSNINTSNVTRENEEIIAHRYFGMA